MGIEEDAVIVFIVVIILVLAGEWIAGMLLLSGKERRFKTCLYGHIASSAAAYFFLFNCYFQVVDGLGNMTFGVGLFILAWVVSVVFMLKLIDLFRNS